MSTFKDISFQFKSDILLCEQLGKNIVYSVIQVGKNALELTLFQVTLEELLEKYQPKVGILLHFTGVGVLNKVLSDDQLAIEKAIQNTLPKSKVGDFYGSLYSREFDQLLSIARKNTVEDILQLLPENWRIVELSIGEGILTQIKEYEIRTPQNIYDFHQGIKQDKNPEPFSKVAYEDLYLRMAAELYVNFQAQKLNQHERLTANQSEEKARILFNKMGTGILVGFLVILLGNFFLLDYLNGKISGLSFQREKHESVLTELSLLGVELEEKQALILESGLNSTTYTAFYVNQLTGTLPSELSLTKLEVSPLLNRRIKNQKKIFLDHNKITIEGATNSDDELNRWIQTLKNEDWVQNVKLLDYTTESYISTKIFKIEISL